MFDVTDLLQNLNVIGALLLIGAIIFAESGLLIGILLPGDTLLFTAGFFAARGDLPLAGVMAVIFVAAILGDNVGYFVGGKAGHHIFNKKDSLLFRREHIARARRFYDKHGGKTVMFARFVPYIRTFAPMVAGAAGMHRLKFIVYNIAGALLWTISFVLVGYWLGVTAAEQVAHYLGPALVAVFIFTFSPTIIYFFRNARLRTYIGSRLEIVWAALTAPFHRK